MGFITRVFLTIMIATLIFVSYNAVINPSAPSPAPPAPSYEHKLIVADTLISEAHLDRLGADGWELITIIAAGEDFYFYFKRLVVERR